MENIYQIGVRFRCAMPKCRKSFIRKTWNQKYCNFKCSMQAALLKQKKIYLKGKRKKKKPLGLLVYELEKKLERCKLVMTQTQKIKAGVL